MKRLLLIAASLACFALAMATDFTPDFTLTGVTKLKFITADFYHQPSGYNFTSQRRTIPMPFKPTQTVQFDFDAQVVKIEILMLNSYPLITPIYMDMQRYQELALYQAFKDKLYENVRAELDKTDRSTGQGLIPEIVIDLPKSALPKAVRKFMGNKAGRLNLDGSEKITIGGTSSHRSSSQDEGDQNNDFDLDFRQDLNLRLNGTIGEKVHVNVTHQSSSEDSFVSNPSTIQINYQGTEDEIVKMIEGGNLSLSLTGSKFISYSVSSEGMFGIKGDFEAGNIKMTAIFGRDEAKKDTKKYKGSAEADSSAIYSKSYVRRTHYFIDDPYQLYDIYTEAEVAADPLLPASYANNAIKVGDNGGWTIKNSYLLPDREKDFILYYDDGLANNNNLTFEGTEIGHPETTYFFETRVIGTDYVVDWDNGIVILNETVDKRATIGIIYTRLDGVKIGNDATKEVKLLRKSNQELETDPQYWKLQMRNVYYLGMENVDRDGFLLNVFDENQDKSKNYTVPDSVASGMTFNEYLRLDTNGSGTINDDDATVDLASGYVYFSLLEPFKNLGDANIYSKDIDYITFEDYHMIIGVKGKIGRETINLGLNILPGSVVVRVGTSKRKLTENIDYIVDYDFGLVTLLSADAKDPNQGIEIDYQYKPIFAVDSKTLVGTRADWQITDNLQLGGTFIYQSETVKEDRPKLGNENRSVILADLDGELEYEAPFLTRAVDFLPLIRTDEDSNLRLTGEVALSAPNIYGDKDQADINEAYIDDMESTLDAFNLGTTRSLWMPASTPYNTSYPKAHVNWYNPQNIYFKDVFDPASLTQKEEEEKVQVLTFKLTDPDVNLPGTTDRYWGGVMKYIGDNLDFTDKKYIEVLAKVDDANGVTPEVVMHINLGKLSEDFYRPGENDKPDTEDKNSDGKLDADEDYGLDNIRTGKPGDDPDDDYDNKKITVGNEEEYPEINGMEGNDRLDSEDLDNNGTLNTSEVYLDYTISLNSDNYMESQYNGWRLYRIPLSDDMAYNVISDNPSLKPSLSKVNFARVWFEAEQTSRIKLVTLDIVGNKWEDNLIKDDNGNIYNDDNEVVQAGVADNQKDQHYTSAPGTEIKKDGEITLEQSLAVDFLNIKESHNATVTQNFKQDPLNLLSYSKIRFWVYPEKAKTDPSATPYDQTLIIRLGADSLTYYEVRTPITFTPYATSMNKDNWKEISIEFSDLTKLKTQPDTLLITEKDGMKSYTTDNITYSMIYRNVTPVLTNIKEITLGVHADSDFHGRIYFDDIRVADPYEDVGYASNVSFHSTLADFATVDVSYEWKTANFQNSGSRDTDLSNNQETRHLSASTQIKLNKFFPSEWGLSMPLNLNYQLNNGTPLYQSNSDILREDLEKDEKKRQKSSSKTQRADISFSQTRVPKNKILEYLVKNTTLSTSLEKRETLSAVSRDTTLSYSMKHVYKLSIPKDNVGLRLFGEYKFYYLPNTFNNTVNFQASEPRRWRYDAYNDSLNPWTPVAQTTDTRTINTDSYVKYDIFSDVESSYKLTTKRDLTLKNYLKDVNIGEEKERRQDISLDYNPSYLDKYFTFNVDTSVKYNEQHLQSGTVDTLHYKGNVKRNISGRLTLKNKDLLQGLVRNLETKYKVTVKKEQPETTPQYMLDDFTNLSSKDDLTEEEKEKLLSLRSTINPEARKMEELEKRRAERKKQEEPMEPEEFVEPEEPGEPSPEETGEKLIPQPDETAIADTSASLPQEPEEETHLLLDVINYLSRLDNITFNYSNTYSTNYDDLDDRPSFLYQIGSPHEIDQEFISLKTVVNKYSASTGLLLLKNLTTSWNYSLDINKKYGNVKQMTVSTVFPSVSVTLSEVEKLLHAEKVLTSSRLSGSYSITRIEDGDIDFTTPKSEQIRVNLAPLVSWNGNWANNIITTISTNYMDNKRITNNTSGKITVSNNTWSASANISYTFTAERGIKMPFTTRKVKFSNELTADLGLSYEDSYSTTDNSSDDKKATVDIDKVRFSISPSANYKFSKNITGGLICSYDKTNDKKREDTISTFQLSFFVEVFF